MDFYGNPECLFCPSLLLAEFTVYSTSTCTALTLKIPSDACGKTILVCSGACCIAARDNCALYPFKNHMELKNF